MYYLEYFFYEATTYVLLLTGYYYFLSSSTQRRIYVHLVLEIDSRLGRLCKIMTPTIQDLDVRFM